MKVIAAVVVALLLLTLSSGAFSQYQGVVTTLGSDVTLKCPLCASSELSNTCWQDGALIVQDGFALDNITERFNASCDENFCELTIVNVQIQDAGTYNCCSDNINNADNSFQRTLTIVVRQPTGEQSPAQLVLEEDIVNFTCCMNFAGPAHVSPTLTWTDDKETGSTLIPDGSATNVSESTVNGLDDRPSTFCSELLADVPSGVAFLPKYTCTAKFTNFTNDYGYPNTSWSSTPIRISHCPRNVCVSDVTDDFAVNRRLTCSSDSFPQASYYWILFRGQGVQDTNDTAQFTLTEPGFFNVSCVASNLLRSQFDYCNVTSLPRTGFVPIGTNTSQTTGTNSSQMTEMNSSQTTGTNSSQFAEESYRSAAIALGVLLALAVVALVAIFIIFMISRKRRQKTPPSAYRDRESSIRYENNAVETTSREPSALYTDVNQAETATYEGLQHRTLGQTPSTLYEGLRTTGQ